MSQNTASLLEKIEFLEAELARYKETKTRLEITLSTVIERSAADVSSLNLQLRTTEDKVRLLERQLAVSSKLPRDTQQEADFASAATSSQTQVISASPTCDLISIAGDPVPDLISEETASNTSDVCAEPPTPKYETVSPLTVHLKAHQLSTTVHAEATQKGHREGVQSKEPNWVADQCVAKYDGHPFSIEDFHNYGIQYVPAVNFADTRRRVVLTRIPPKASLTQVLSRIRGGAVVSIELLNTVPITGTQSALVRFNTEAEAAAYDDFVHRHEIKLDGMRLKADVIPTDSYPLSRPQIMAISIHGQTRCLEVDELQGVNLEVLNFDLRLMRGSSFSVVEKLNLRDDGTLEIKLSSIFYASWLFGMLSSRWRYRGCKVRFVRDPCEGILEELLEPLWNLTVL